MHNDVQEILLTEEQLHEKVSSLGKQISADYADSENLLVVGILKGSVVFMADLMREITVPMQIDFMAVSSYGKSAQSSGTLKIKKDLDVPLEGMNVLIVEDILDSGRTLSLLTQILQERGPRSIRIATLMDKPDRRVTDIRPDYVGFVIPDEFVVGYGLDYGEEYRNLPYIGVLKRCVYEKPEEAEQTQTNAEFCRV